MARSNTKGPYMDPVLWDEIFKKKIAIVNPPGSSKNKISNKTSVKILKVLSRGSVIFPTLVHKNVLVHNGTRFLRVRIKKSMVGHKFGEFAYTRRRHLYKSKKKKGRKK
jgi:small subunit ribosomal protein S19